jgi:predicted translin family RNA/ssDNA-binding protein
VDDYQKEIADLETQVARLVAEEGDARTISELTMQLEILKAIYARVIDLYTRGVKDEGLRYGLRIQGYGDWTIDNVYAFVYERSVELEPRAHSAFVGGIKAADFALMLNP